MDRKQIKENFLKDIEDELRRGFMEKLETATPKQLYIAVSKVIMKDVTDAWQRTEEKYQFCDLDNVYYLSQEFLPGRILSNNLSNCGKADLVAEILSERGISLNLLEEQEEEPAIGNGGLGRLASCIMESAITQGYSILGCSLMDRKGFFKQKIENGKQVELPDCWLDKDDPRVVYREKYSQKVTFGKGAGAKIIKAIPVDIPIIGYPNVGYPDVKVSAVRLWDTEYDSDITEKLYPSDGTKEGKILRMKQQYFFVSASVQLAVQQFKKRHHDILQFPKKVHLHLNDTHPAMAIPELMRILLDEEKLKWEEAWEITQKTCVYTNHTVLKEALEEWPIDLFEELLPRIYEIIHEIDKRFVAEIRKDYPGNEEKVKSMAILYDGKIKMANLAIIGSNSVNGVAKIHTGILEDEIFKDLYDRNPWKFKNVTNGVTQRRFVVKANPLLTRWISEKCKSSSWITQMEYIQKLEKFSDDEKAQDEFIEIKQENKTKLADYIQENTGIKVNTNAIFVTQVKRIHEYKRQLMNVLLVRCLHENLKADEQFRKTFHPMVFVFAGKAHPNYENAKLVIEEIQKVAADVNHDESINGLLKVVFLENYNVSKGEKLFAYSDVSVQISTAGKEASGTGNMKFMMNGAVTIGTLDGANVEIKDAAGEENMFIFGINAEEEKAFEKNKEYNSYHIYQQHKDIAKSVDQLCPKLRDSLICGQSSAGDADRYFVLLDLLDYIRAILELNETYKDQRKWARMCILNIANSGYFSIDRTVREYKEKVWHNESIYED